MEIFPFAETLPWYEVSLLAVIIVAEVYGFLILLSLIFPRGRPPGNHEPRAIFRQEKSCTKAAGLIRR
jgi:hypothetical protein